MQRTLKEQHAMNAEAVSLTRYLLEHEAKDPALGAEFCRLMAQIAFAAKIMAHDITRASLLGASGAAGERNASGDIQKTLDVLTNDTMLGVFARTGLVAEIVSEEMRAARSLLGGDDAKFILCTDPLDGSSNVDVNGAVGTIFAVYRRREDCPKDDPRQVLRRGSEQVAAGYIMYGPSSILVYTSSAGVNGFTLDPDIGEFLLSHEQIRCPARGDCFSANLAHLRRWPQSVQKYVQHLTGGESPDGGRYSLRYTGAFVADLHRILIAGGVFLYPGDNGHPAGKLRLLYECAPMALLIEHAGGRASDGARRILDIEASDIHQRTPIAIGGAEEVASFETFFRQQSP
jgi:fructose-1,6-bisphosphatase I